MGLTSTINRERFQNIGASATKLFKKNALETLTFVATGIAVAGIGTYVINCADHPMKRFTGKKQGITCTFYRGYFANPDRVEIKTNDGLLRVIDDYDWSGKIGDSPKDRYLFQTSERAFDVYSRPYQSVEKDLKASFSHAPVLFNGNSAEITFKGNAEKVELLPDSTTLEEATKAYQEAIKEVVIANKAYRGY